MKKIVSAVLCLSLLLALGVAFTSCAHKCTFQEAWTKDDVAHWHACNADGCEEIADKEDHKWDEGRITKPATQEADGVKTFVCTVCEGTKTETVAFTGFSEEEWNAAFADSVFENFTYTENAVTEGSGVSITTETVYKFTKDNAFVKMTMAGESEEMYAPDKTTANALCEQLVASIKDLTPYENYRYDTETKTYKATKPVEIASLGTSTTDITLTFSEGKLTKIEYSVSFVQQGIAFSATATVTLGDYGTVVLNPEA